MRLIAGIAVLALAGCATQKSNDRAAQHASDQIRMIAVQREARVQEAQAESQANAELVKALAEVARANPDHAPAVTVALAVIGVRGAEATSADSPTVTLQREQNVGLEYVKALAPTVGNLVSGLGVAAINASVTKNAQEASRDIQINDANSDVAIVQAVAGLGTAAANSVGIQAGGDIYQVEGQSTLDQSVDTTTTTTTTTTNTSTFTLSTTLNYDGAGITLGELIEQLQGAGASYSIDLDGDGTPDVSGEGEGETVSIVCNLDEPQFSPIDPACYGA